MLHLEISKKMGSKLTLQHTTALADLPKKRDFPYPSNDKVPKFPDNSSIE
jgi:hypothetical protein